MKIQLAFKSKIRYLDEEELKEFTLLLFKHEYLNMSKVNLNPEMQNIIVKIRNIESYYRIFPIHLIFKKYKTEDYIKLINESDNFKARKKMIF